MLASTRRLSSLCTPPLLGFVSKRRDPFDLDLGRLFIPTTSFRPLRYHPDRRNCILNAVHSSHGRVVLHSWPYKDLGYTLEDLFVWDFIMDKLRKLPKWPLYSHYSCSHGNAAVLCAGAVAAGDGCNHLDCNHGAFMVVFVGIDQYARGRTFVSAYSSEADGWSEPVYADQRCYCFQKGNSVLIGSVVYFKCLTMSTDEHAILKYDLLTREILRFTYQELGTWNTLTGRLYCWLWRMAY